MTGDERNVSHGSQLPAVTFRALRLEWRSTTVDERRACLNQYHLDAMCTESADQVRRGFGIGNDAIHVLDTANHGKAALAQLARVSYHGYLTRHSNHESVELCLKDIWRRKPQLWIEAIYS